jgi:hypothetical protein
MGLPSASIRTKIIETSNQAVFSIGKDSRVKLILSILPQLHLSLVISISKKYSKEYLSKLVIMNLNQLMCHKTLTLKLPASNPRDLTFLNMLAKNSFQE